MYFITIKKGKITPIKHTIYTSPKLFLQQNKARKITRYLIYIQYIIGILVNLAASHSGQILSSNVGHFFFHMNPQTSYLQLILSSAGSNVIEQSHILLNGKSTRISIITFQDNPGLKTEFKIFFYL